MEGKLVSFKNFSVTDDADTTAVMYLGGLLPWRIVNQSGASATFTFYSGIASDDDEITPYDCDSVAVPSYTVADDCDQELQPGLGGVLWLIVKGAAAADNITLICRR